MALMDVRPITGQEGTLIVPFAGWPIDAGAQLFGSADGLYLLYKAPNIPLIHRSGLYSGAMPDLAPAGDNASVFQTQDRRFLVSAHAIFDVDAFQTAYAGDIGRADVLGLAHPTGDTFVTLDTQAATLTRYDIRQ
jgi:hypothetical protein